MVHVGGSIPPLGTKKMTDLQFIRLLKYALKPNKKGNKASIINALELVEIFKDKVIEDYLKEVKSIRNNKKT